jgi:hypothetical protein
MKLKPETKTYLRALLDGEDLTVQAINNDPELVHGIVTDFKEILLEVQATWVCKEPTGHCDYGHEDPDVRLLPTDVNVIAALCQKHWEQEMNSKTIGYYEYMDDRDIKYRWDELERQEKY